jgi:hypothetical protein
MAVSRVVTLTEAADVRLPWQPRATGRELFRAHELAVLDAIRGELRAEGARLLDLQVAATRWVNRYIDDSYVDLVPGRRGQGPVVHDESIAFANRSLDLKLATVQVRGTGGSGKAVASCVNGQFFEMYFAPSPKRLGKSSAIQVGKVTLHVDPMKPASGSAGHPQLVQLDVPLRAELDAIWASRPQWAAVVASPDEVYSVYVDGAEYLVLAQLPDTTYVAAPLDPPGSGAWRFEPDGDPIATYPTLQQAIASSVIARH